MKRDRYPQFRPWGPALGRSTSPDDYTLEVDDEPALPPDLEPVDAVDGHYHRRNQRGNE